MKGYGSAVEKFWSGGGRCGLLGKGWYTSVRRVPPVTGRGVQALVVTLATLLGAANAHAELPYKAGTHRYAGEVCTWASFEDGLYIEMAYRDFKGRVEPVGSATAAGNPFAWKMHHPDGRTMTTGGSSTAKGAVNALCGHMIDAQERPDRPNSYDRGEAYRELVAALDTEPED